MNPKYLASTLTLTLLLSVQTAAQVDSPVPEEAVKAHMKALSDRGLNRAMVVGIVNPEGKRYLFEGTFREGDTRKVNARTVFEISSLTELFTSLMVVDLAQKGEFDLKATASQYLTEDLTLPKFEEEEITLRHLLLHTSGLPRLPDNLEPENRQNPFVDYTEKALGQFLGKYELKAGPGKSFKPSRVGYGLLGIALEKQTGETFEELVQTRICSPLEMKNTSISLNEVQRYNLARGHQGETQMPHWDMMLFAGSGGLRSDTKDMLRFVEANLGLTDNPLSPAMNLSHKIALASDDSDLAVATGWVVLKREETLIYYRSGLTGGHASFAGFRKDTQTGVVIMSNSASSVEDIGIYLLDPDHHKLKEFLPMIEISDDALRQYTGVFQLPNGFRILFHRNEGHLTTQFETSSRYRLQPVEEDTFHHPKMKINLEFQRNPKGIIDKVSFKQGEEELTATRVRI